MPDDPHRRSTLARIGGAIRRGARRMRDRRKGAQDERGPVTLDFQGMGTVEVPSGTTILAAARQAGIDLPHYCGGTCSCGTCRVEIASGTENLSNRQGREEMVLGSERTRAGDRLACQARVIGAVSVTVPEWF